MIDGVDSRTIAFVNARIAGFGHGVLRFREHIVSIGLQAEPGDHCVDLRGDRLLPGLINAHDHLHRNHYPRLKYRDRYDNASEWAADIDARRDSDALLKACAALPLADRLAVGGLKNLLSGATSVAHHDRPFAEFESREFPVHVLSRYRWVHSLAIDGIERVRRSHAATPADVPWFIHAGEGVDGNAAGEAAQLEASGVLTPNTVLVHGIAFDAAAYARLLERRVGLVWCPGSNNFLYGRAAAPGALARAGLLALGSDSRLSGARDLLDELQCARRSGAVSDASLESLVTANAARLLRMPDRGVLRAGAIADFVVLPRDAQLWEVRRADLRCVIMRGDLRCGDSDYAHGLLAPAMHVNATIDGRRKVLAKSVAALLARHAVHEPGVTLISGDVRAA